MKKALLIMFALLMISIGVSITVYGDTEYVFDYKGTFTQEELEKLDEYGKSVYDATNIKVFFVMEDVIDSGDSIDVFAEKFYEEHSQGVSCCILALTDEAYYFLPLGEAADIINLGNQDALWDAYNGAENDYQGVIAFFEEAERVINDYNSKANIDLSDELQGKRMIDNAELMEPIPKSTVSDYVDKISVTHQCNLIILTVPSVYGKTLSTYSEEYYNYYDFGYGDTDDGVILIFDKDTSQWYVEAYGSVKDYFNQDVLDYIDKQIKPLLRRKHYDEAFTTFADSCEMVLSDGESGIIHNKDSLPKVKMSVDVAIYIVIVIAVIAVIVFAVVKKKNNGGSK